MLVHRETSGHHHFQFHLPNFTVTDCLHQNRNHGHPDATKDEEKKTEVPENAAIEGTTEVSKEDVEQIREQIENREIREGLTAGLGQKKKSRKMKGRMDPGTVPSAKAKTLAKKRTKLEDDILKYGVAVIEKFYPRQSGKTSHVKKSSEHKPAYKMKPLPHDLHFEEVDIRKILKLGSHTKYIKRPDHSSVVYINRMNGLVPLSTLYKDAKTLMSTIVSLLAGRNVRMEKKTEMPRGADRMVEDSSGVNEAAMNPQTMGTSRKRVHTSSTKFNDNDWAHVKKNRGKDWNGPAKVIQKDVKFPPCVIRKVPLTINIVIPFCKPDTFPVIEEENHILTTTAQQLSVITSSESSLQLKLEAKTPVEQCRKGSQRKRWNKIDHFIPLTTVQKSPQLKPEVEIPQSNETGETIPTGTANEEENLTSLVTSQQNTTLPTRTANEEDATSLVTSQQIENTQAQLEKEEEVVKYQLHVINKESALAGLEFAKEDRQTLITPTTVNTTSAGDQHQLTSSITGKLRHIPSTRSTNEQQCPVNSTTPAISGLPMQCNISNKETRKTSRRISGIRNKKSSGSALRKTPLGS